VLQDNTEVTGAYIEVRSEADGSDDIRIVVGPDQSDLDAEKLAEKLQAHLRVKPELVIKPSVEVIKKMTGEGGRKPKKFFDFRTVSPV
jgi:hypothetical protein